uniref:Uncharacterized protein n=1 Tax=Glossina palpalis gambiensis TaxID=67801 RepID=A0A1B0C451_9MUSC
MENLYTTRNTDIFELKRMEKDNFVSLRQFSGKLKSYIKLSVVRCVFLHGRKNSLSGAACRRPQALIKGIMILQEARKRERVTRVASEFVKLQIGCKCDRLDGPSATTLISPTTSSILYIFTTTVDTCRCLYSADLSATFNIATHITNNSTIFKMSSHIPTCIKAKISIPDTFLQETHRSHSAPYCILKGFTSLYNNFIVTPI